MYRTSKRLSVSGNLSYSATVPLPSDPERLHLSFLQPIRPKSEVPCCLSCICDKFLHRTDTESVNAAVTPRDPLLGLNSEERDDLNKSKKKEAFSYLTLMPCGKWCHRVSRGVETRASRQHPKAYFIWIPKQRLNLMLLYHSHVSSDTNQSSNLGALTASCAEVAKTACRCAAAVHA